MVVVRSRAWRCSEGVSFVGFCGRGCSCRGVVVVGRVVGWTVVGRRGRPWGGRREVGGGVVVVVVGRSGWIRRWLSKEFYRRVRRVTQRWRTRREKP